MKTIKSPPPDLADYTSPEEIRSAINEIRADEARETAVLAARDAFNLSGDVRADVPGIHGRIAFLLLSLASRVLYRYAIRNPKSGGGL